MQTVIDDDYKCKSAISSENFKVARIFERYLEKIDVISSEKKKKTMNTLERI